jgi:hypothetical protein
VESRRLRAALFHRALVRGARFDTIDKRSDIRERVASAKLQARLSHERELDIDTRQFIAHEVVAAGQFLIQKTQVILQLTFDSGL